MSRNVFAASNNTAFNTSDGIQDVKVFDDDDYLLNEEATEHKYLHRHHQDSQSLGQLQGHHS
jgi:hypothetical protein